MKLKNVLNPREAEGCCQKTQYLLEPLMGMPENNHKDARLLHHVIYLKYLIEVTMLLEGTS